MLAVASVLVSGCSPEIVGVVGLQRVGEHVHAYVQMCDGHSVDSVRMVEQLGTFEDEWTFDTAVTDSGSIDIGVFDDAVALIDTGNEFSIGADSSTSDDHARGPTFRSADLARLEDGEILIWAGSGQPGTQQLDKTEFTTFVEGYC